MREEVKKLVNETATSSQGSTFFDNTSTNVNSSENSKTVQLSNESSDHDTAIDSGILDKELQELKNQLFDCAQMDAIKQDNNDNNQNLNLSEYQIIYF